MRKVQNADAQLIQSFLDTKQAVVTKKELRNMEKWNIEGVDYMMPTVKTSFMIKKQGELIIYEFSEWSSCWDSGQKHYMQHFNANGGLVRTSTSFANKHIPNNIRVALNVAALRQKLGNKMAALRVRVK